jgi:hypothetical protein
VLKAPAPSQSDAARVSVTLESVGMGLARGVRSENLTLTLPATACRHGRRVRTPNRWLSRYHAGHAPRRVMTMVNSGTIDAWKLVRSIRSLEHR